MKVSLVIPAINEAKNIRSVLSAVPRQLVCEIIVVDGGSSDQTVEIAIESGARVIHEDRRGYGQACAAGVEASKGEILVFMDADGADDPSQIFDLLEPLAGSEVDMVLGSRLAGEIAEGAMPWHQWFGNWLSAVMIRCLYNLPITDLSPFRAIRKASLLKLFLQEMTYGWPTEMITKAARHDYGIVEIPVNYRPRVAGKSKISGTVRGTLLATYYILWTIIQIRLQNFPG